MVAVIAVSITLVILSASLAIYCSTTKKKRSESSVVGSNPLLLDDTLDMPISQLEVIMSPTMQHISSPS